MLLATDAARFTAPGCPDGLAMTLSTDAPDAPLESVAELLRQRARERGAQLAFTFTDEAGAEVAWTYAQLDSRAAAVACKMRCRWSRVFWVWHGRQSAWRFARPFDPPSASGSIWSTW